MQIERKYIDAYETYSNHESLLEQLRSYLGGKNLTQKPFDMEGHAKKCVERYCELAKQKTEQMYKVSTPCLDDHNYKKEEWLESCPKYAHRLS